MKKVFLALCCCVLAFGFWSCSSTPPVPASPPVISRVVVGASEADANSLTHQSTIQFSENANSIWIGIDANDADKDMRTVTITIKQNGATLSIGGQQAVIEGSLSGAERTAKSGMLSRLNLGGMAFTGLTVEVAITDSKENKTVSTSPVFETLGY